MPTSGFSRALDRALEVVLWLVLGWLPFAFGGVLPLSHMVLVGGVSLLALGFALRCVLTRHSVVGSLAFVPVLLFLGLVALQAWPGGAAALAGFAPENARLWSELTGTPPLVEPLAPPVTLNPAATVADLRLLLALAALLVLSAQLLREDGAMRRCLTAMTVIGAGIAVVALVQDLTGSDQLLWLTKARGKATSGPFVHYGHFSQFVNLTIGCGLGLVLLRLADRDRRNQYKVEDLARDLGAPDRRLDLFAYAFVVLAIVAICLSNSRNGVLSMVLAGVVTGSMLHLSRYLLGMGWSLGALALLALLVLMFVGLDPVYDRLSTLDEGSIYDFRLALARDALRAFTQFRWLGSGQGTFGDVFPLFDTMERPGRAEHAENQYVELLVETGLVGVGLMAAFLLLTFVPWMRRLWRHRHTADGALFGVLFGVVAVLIHASSDFGLRIPAVAALMAVCLGMVLGRTGRLGAGVAVRWSAALLALATAAGLAWQLPQLDQERIAYDYAADAKVAAERATKAGSAEELLRWRTSQRGNWAAAVEAMPQRADYQAAYATAAWQSVIAAEQVEFDAPTAPLAKDQEQRLQEAAKLIQSALLEARRLCPIRGDLWSLVGQLGVEWLGDAAAAAWIERGFRFSPENPTVCTAWARQLLKQGDAAAAARMFARAIRMGGDAGGLLQAIIQDAGRPEIGLEIARTNPRMLLSLVQRYRSDPQRQEFYRQARLDLTVRLRELTARHDAEAWTFVGLAEIEAEDGRGVEAVALYRRYLTLVPMSGVRLTLARLLQQQGDLPSARQEVQRYLNYAPGDVGAKRMLAELGM